VGEVTFDLEPVADQVVLTLTHRRLPSRDASVGVGAGWHMHLDILVARIQGQDAPSFWSGWARLRDEYERRFAG
jgi:hypothetical protein